MSSGEVYRFVKTISCPSSEDLLSVHLAALPVESTSEIISHLVVCDFCVAEAHFLSRVQDKAVTSPLPEMPTHLRLLAESLLRNRAPTL
jgi:hypothetical protein